MRIALSSLAPVGEDPHSQNPVQSQLNDLCAAYNDVIRAVSSREGTDYIEFYEAFADQLNRSKTVKPLPGSLLRPSTATIWSGR